MQIYMQWKSREKNKTTQNAEVHPHWLNYKDPDSQSESETESHDF